MESRSRQHAPPAVPGYEIMSFLGAGGTSTVWLARQLSLDRVVAIKVLSPALLTDDTAREQFQKEARAAAKLSHPAIVGIVDFGEHDGGLNGGRINVLFGVKAGLRTGVNLVAHIDLRGGILADQNYRQTGPAPLLSKHFGA